MEYFDLKDNYSLAEDHLFIILKYLLFMKEKNYRGYKSGPGYLVHCIELSVADHDISVLIYINGCDTSV